MASERQLKRIIIVIISLIIIAVIASLFYFANMCYFYRKLVFENEAGVSERVANFAKLYYFVAHRRHNLVLVLWLVPGCICSYRDF